MRAPTQYATSGDISIAYQVVGEGPLDLVFVMGWVSHLDWNWKEPHFARFLHRLASFSRLILFDKRGTGLSDRAVGLPSLEQRMDDVRAVMDAARSQRAALFGISEGGPMCALFAAAYPERTSALITFGTYARRLWAPDYPWGEEPEARRRFVEHLKRNWGADLHLPARAPSLADNEHFRDWWATYLRMSASPGSAAALTKMNAEVDIREILPTIRVPTLILHRAGDRAVPVEGSRLMAERIPGARYLELPGDDHFPFVGDQDAVLDEIQQFLTGARPAEADRVLATVVAMEIDGAATSAARLGPRRWAEARAEYAALTHEAIDRFRGRAAVRAADGCLVAFDGPARAVRCAEAVVSGARRLGLRARAGLHAGEVVAAGPDISGVAVELAARVAARAEAGQVVVSGTVRDLVVGSGLEFTPLTPKGRAPTGLPEDWRLFSLAAAASPPSANPRTLSDGPRDHRPAVVLSPREREVARLLALGLTNRAISAELSIAIGTVERHVANILAKLGFGSRAQIAVWAVEQHLLERRED